MFSSSEIANSETEITSSGVFFLTSTKNHIQIVQLQWNIFEECKVAKVN